jgi:hypothetical protein
MSCPACASANQSEFPVEMIIHLTDLKNVNNPGVLLFPRLLVCLDCGFLRYKVPFSELPLLGRDAHFNDREEDYEKDITRVGG